MNPAEGGWDVIPTEGLVNLVTHGKAFRQVLGTRAALELKEGTVKFEKTS